MRLGAPLFEPYTDPDSWIAALRRANYAAAYCPQIPAGFTVSDFANAALRGNILIAEVGAWHNNPLSQNDTVRRAAIREIQAKLALADEMGANCCVNVAGSRGEKWDGPDLDDLTPATFDLIVESVREIIDGVKPKRTFYSLETMPWMYPDSTESYVQLVQAIDRPAFAVHFDPVNLISSPQRFFNNGAVMQEFITALGPQIKSVHVKDLVLLPTLTTHLDEVRPGAGKLDYPILLDALYALGLDLPLMLEHMSDPNDYVLGAQFIRATAEQVGVPLL